MQFRSATRGIAVVGVQLEGLVDHAVHVLHGEGDAGHLVILEDGHVDDHVAFARKDLGEANAAPRPTTIAASSKPAASERIAAHAAGIAC